MSSAQSAEAQSRLNVMLKDIVNFFEQAKVDERSISVMENFIEKHLTVDLLTLAEGFGKCMAFIDHDELISLLLKAYTQLLDGYVIERKIVYKRWKPLTEDKKADPVLLNRLENLIADIDARKSIAMDTLYRLKVMNAVPLACFHNPKFDATAHYKKVMAEKSKEVQATQQSTRKK